VVEEGRRGSPSFLANFPRPVTSQEFGDRI
jgi:hypothetical protein